MRSFPVVIEVVENHNLRRIRDSVRAEGVRDCREQLVLAGFVVDLSGHSYSAKEIETLGVSGIVREIGC